MNNNQLVQVIQLFLLPIILGCFHNAIFAQGNASVRANAAVSARIVEPVGISKTFNSDFGNGATIVAGMVEMKSSSIHNAPSGNFFLPAITGVFTAVFFNLSGVGGYSYSVIIPSSPLLIKKGSNTLQVTSFTSDPTLGADPKMIAGVYVSVSPMSVMVNYN